MEGYSLKTLLRGVKFTGDGQWAKRDPSPKNHSSVGHVTIRGGTIIIMLDSVAVCSKPFFSIGICGGI